MRNVKIVNRLSWFASAKQWARDTWAELMDPSDVVERRQVEARQAIHVLLEEAADIATRALLDDAQRAIRYCRVAIQDGREKVAADALQTKIVAYKSRQTSDRAPVQTGDFR